MVTTCKRCGAQMRSEAKFCTQCGSSVEHTQPPQVSDAVLMQAKGVSEWLELMQNAVRIRRRSGKPRPDKEIQIRDIASIRLKAAGMAKNGFISFDLGGGGKEHMGLLDALADEDSVIFTYQHRREFEAIKNAIEQRMEAFRRQGIQRPRAPSAVLMRADGIGGQLELLQNAVRIRREGAFAKMSHGLKGDKEIRIHQISSIQFKQAGFTNGYIQFSFSGGKENKDGIRDATKDENTVMFAGTHASEFEAIKNAIEQRMDEIHSGAHAVPQPQQTDVVEQIEGLARLRDRGILSEQEFQAKKQDLLSRL